jgi:glycosyltransferase involved in cell wall biosynthesis
MAKIAINGMSAKSGGGRSVLRNILGCLVAESGGHEYLVITPTGAGYGEFACSHLKVIEVAGLYRLHKLAWFSLVRLPKLLREQRCDLLFNPSDIPIPTSIPQVFLYDWPHGAFPESPAIKKLELRDWLIYRAKLFLFTYNLRYIDILAAQTSVIAECLHRLYGHGDIVVIPNAVSLENFSGGEPLDFALGEELKLLCLSGYYTHKNLEIFLPVARKLRERGFKAKIVITVAAEQHPNAARMLEQIAEEDLEAIIHNVGPVDMAHVPSLYSQCDVLILPTLLESFSGTYVEAMFHRKPILTSQLPFAEVVCGDGALYFDPFDVAGIVDQIEKLLKEPELRASLATMGAATLASMPSWPGVVQQLVAEFDRALTVGAAPWRRANP